MTAPRYGFEFQRSSYEARPVIPYDMSTIGFVLPSDDADASITWRNSATASGRPEEAMSPMFQTTKRSESPVSNRV